jgi:hypothetical protein
VTATWAADALGLLLDRKPDSITVQVITSAFLQTSAGEPVGVLEAGGDELAAVRVLVDDRTLIIPVTLAMVEAIEQDPAGDTAVDVALAMAEAWTADWAWSSNPGARRIWCDPFDLNDDPALTSPTIR